MKSSWTGQFHERAAAAQRERPVAVGLLGRRQLAYPNHVQRLVTRRLLQFLPRSPSAGRYDVLGKIQRAQFVEELQPPGRLRQVDLVGHAERPRVGQRPRPPRPGRSGGQPALRAPSRSSTSWHSSMPSSLPRSTTSRARSAARISPYWYRPLKSSVIGGVSINCTGTSSKGIMPGAGTCVVNG